MQTRSAQRSLRQVAMTVVVTRGLNAVYVRFAGRASSAVRSRRCVDAVDIPHSRWTVPCDVLVAWMGSRVAQMPGSPLQWIVDCRRDPIPENLHDTPICYCSAAGYFNLAPEGNDATFRFTRSFHNMLLLFPFSMGFDTKTLWLHVYQVPIRLLVMQHPPRKCPGRSSSPYTHTTEKQMHCQKLSRNRNRVPAYSYHKFSITNCHFRRITTCCCSRTLSPASSRIQPHAAGTRWW